MGYVAWLQQFDTAAPWAPAPASPAAAPEPDPAERSAELTTVLGVAAVPPHVADVVPAEVYEVRLPAQRPPAGGSGVALPEPPTFVARIPTSIPVARPRARRRRLQAAVATMVAVAGLSAVGVGVAAFTRTGNPTRAQAPVIAAVPPLDGTLPGDGGVPGADPVATLPTKATTAATKRAPATTAATTAATVVPSASSQPGSASPSAAQEAAAAPADESDQTDSAPARLRPAATTAGRLDATLSYTAKSGDDGTSRYRGTVVLVSTKPDDAGAWRLTLTVPGGNQVVAQGPVLVSQDGESVLFTPGDGGIVPAGGSLTFSFAIRGVLAELPANCTINGHACS